MTILLPVMHGAQHMIFGLPSAGGYDGVVPERSLHVWLIVAGAPVDQVLQKAGWQVAVRFFFSLPPPVAHSRPRRESGRPHFCRISALTELRPPNIAS